MPRPRSTKADPADTQPRVDGEEQHAPEPNGHVSALDELRTIIGEHDLPAGVPEALLALAQAIDRLGQPLELEPVQYDGSHHAAGIVELDDRVREIESRLSEAGRRMIWAATPTHGRNPHPARWLPDIGRVLLFDPETPNPEPAEQATGGAHEAAAGTGGTATVENLMKHFVPPGGPDDE